MTKRLADLFKVRAGEERTVSLVLAMTFLVTVGGSVGGNAIEALFFSRQGTSALPALYMALGATNFVVSLGITAVATGTNADDVVAGFRPGIRAAAERGAITPLRDAGLTKQEIRTASRDWGLVTWDKPAAACLSSRIAYGIEVTPQRLARVERAETSLRATLHGAGVPVRNLRVRDLGDRARVEVDREYVDAVAAHLPALLHLLADFTDVELDPLGFRSGSMNELLAEPQRWR